MRKFVLLAALLAVLVAAALPAFADKGRDNGDRNDGKNRQHQRHNGGGGNGGPAISQESEQDAESGELNQSFNVSQTGDNSNQCVGLQGVGNTGEAQNLFDLTQVNSEADDVDAEEIGSTIDESPVNTTTCDQQVNQAASAAANPPPFCTWWVDQYGVDVCRWSADGTDWIVDSSGSWRIYAPYAGWRTAASDIATGALGTAGGLTTLGVLATLGLAGTGLAIRRTRSD